MVKWLVNLTTVFEFLSFLASVIFCFKKDPPRYLKFFSLFLLITVIVEAGALVMRSYKISPRPMLNFFSAFEIVFYLFVLYHVIQDHRVKRIILYSGILYPVVSLVEILSHSLEMFHFITYSLGAILLVCFCIYYFYELSKKVVYQKPGREPAFWICLGLLFYYSCTLPLWAAINFIQATDFEIKMFVFIVEFTNYFLYSCFAIAFFNFYKSPKAR